MGADEPASVQVTGEIALSLPNPNTRGDVYLDDFEASDELRLSVRSRDWHLGSAMEEMEGLGSDLPLSLDRGNALGVVWQDTWILEGPGGDSLGIFEGFFPSRDIDQEINIAGTQTREPGLRVTFGQEAGGGVSQGEAGWRSITSVLSNTGSDLTVAKADALYVEFQNAGLKSAQYTTGDYYCSLSPAADSRRRQIVGNWERGLKVDDKTPFETPPRPGTLVQIQIRLQKPYVDPQRCIGCGICQHECPVPGKRAIRVTADGESRDREHALLLRR